MNVYTVRIRYISVIKLCFMMLILLSSLHSILFYSANFICFHAIHLRY